jgi:Alpha/beta hydrolase domain
MKRSIGAVLAFLALAAVSLLAPSPVAADGRLGQPRATQAGTFDGIAYVQYDGIFEGQTSTGEYRVPYRITAPADPLRGNGTVLVEPPHYAIGLGTLDVYLRRDFLFSRGFAHASVGYSTTSYGDGFNLRILDPTVPGVFIHGGVADDGGRTDDEIIVDFADALASDRDARALLGRVARRYVTGFSDSSNPVLRLVTSGRAASVFDFALPFIARGYDPQAAITTGRYEGKLIIVNSESEGVSGDFVDRGGTPNQYRFYAVAGAPHVPDLLVSFFSNMTTPASYQPALRAHFLQGDSWVKGGTPPPPSTHLKTSDGVTLDRDANGNAISVNARGQRVPRLPFVELGEARFIAGSFLGSYDDVKTIADLGFKNHEKYVKAFNDKLADYLKAGYILREDAEAMGKRATLCAPLTFTETYRDHYEAFTAIVPCSG